MLIKLPIFDDGKIMYTTFKLDKHKDYFILSLIENKNYLKNFKKVNEDNDIDTINDYTKSDSNTIDSTKSDITCIKIMTCNNIKGLFYLNIYFPLKIICINDLLWTNYFFNITVISDFTTKFDFFYELNSIINQSYNYNFIKFDDLQNISYDIWKISNNEYQSYLSNKNSNNINQYLKNMWEYNCLLINMSLFLLLDFPNFTNKNIKDYQTKNNILKKIITIANNIKVLKFKIFFSNSYNLNEHINYYKNEKIKNISELEINKNYFIKINESKYILIKIDNIVNGNIIFNDIEINLNKYELYHYNPTLKISLKYIYFILFNMKEVYSISLSKSDNNIELIHHEKILNYYFDNSKLSNLFYLINKYTDNTEYTDFELLKSNNYDNIFFKYIVKKYTELEKVLLIIKILFVNYNFPIKFNKFEIEPIFDDILYISLYNYKKLIYCNTTKQPNENKIFLINDLNQVIPSKVKLFYYNILKIFYQLFNSSEEYIYNIKFFHDNLYKNFIKIFFYENCNTLNLLKEMLNPSIIEKIKYNMHNNLVLIDIVNKITWDNLKNKTDYLSILVKNKTIFYQDKLNKIIFSDTYDNRIKSIILNPFEMFNFLQYENEFVEWILLFNYKIPELYFNEISLSSNDIIDLGKLIYYLYNIEEQDFKDEYYKLLINHASKNNKIILFNHRINIKIKEFFTLKVNLNFGILAKHLNNNSNQTLICTDTKNEIVILKNQLKLITKKYLKYKKKYTSIKNNLYKTDELIDTLIPYSL
jgi:hypothetical protein